VLAGRYDYDKFSTQYGGISHGDPGMDIRGAEIAKKSLVGAVINGVINAGISATSFFKQEAVPITLDHISNHEVTVFGQGVLLAFMLTLILTGINYMTVAKDMRKTKKEKAFPHPFWPWGAKLAFRNGLAAFGAAMVVAVMWQRFVGTIMVPPLVATLMMFAIAFLFTVYASVATTSAMVQEQTGK
jgi:hypothetical protein